MSKHVRKILPLLLCLLLMTCLLPAAYADGVEVSTLAELQNALNSHARSITFANDLIVPETDITVPSGVTLTVQDVTFWANNIEVQQGGSIIADSGNMSAMNRLTVNGSLIINDAVVIADGSSWANLKNASITYGNEDSKISLHFPTFNSQEARAAIATAAEITSQRVNPLVFINYDAEIRDNYVIPEGVTVEHSGLIITDGATLTVNGKFRTMMEGILTVNGNLINNGILNVWDNGTVNIPGSLSNNGRVTVEETGTLNVQGNLTSSDDILVRDFGTVNVVPGGSMTNNGKIDLSTSGVLRIGGVFQGNPGSRIEVPDADLANIRPRVIIENGGEFNGMGGVMISQSILDVVDRSAIIYGADLSQWCDAVDKYNGPGYFPGKDIVPEIFVGMCESGRFSQIRLRGTGNLSLTDNLTIPEGVYLKVRNGSTLTVPAGKTLTINGKIEASFNGKIDVAGTLQNNGEIEMFDGGVVDVKGTYAHAAGRPIVFNKDGREDAVNPTLIVEQGANCTLNLFRTDEGLTSEDVIEGFDVSAYCYHRNYDRDNHVIRELRVYYPSWMAGIMDMENRAIGYLEIHNLDTFTLFGDAEIPVYDDITPAWVDMSETTLVVPSGMTLTVNGFLRAKAVEVQTGGSITVNGELMTRALTIQSEGSVTVNEGSYLDIGGGGLNILDGGTLTINNTWIDGPYPKSNPGTLNNIVYEGDDAGIILHLEVGNPDGVASALADASAASSKHVHCYVQLLTDWTMTGTINVPNILLEIPGKYTVNIDGELTIGEIQNWGTINLNEKGRLSPSDMSLNGVINVVGKDSRLNEVKLHDLVNGRPRGSITIADATAKVNIRYNGLVEELLPEWITLQGSGTEACICYRADNEQDFVGMTGAISSLPAGFVGSLRVQYPAVIQDNLDFPGVELRVEGRKGGSLTIAEGATLTARNVNLHSAVMTVSGTFIAGPSYRHSGSVTMNSDDGNNSTLIVTDTGILGGYQCTVEVPKGVETASCVSGISAGQMKDVSHPYRPSFQIYLIVAEMSLPTGLQTIESEAFAGGSFNSVYIPEGVTSIAPDAFGDRSGLKVYGEYGTAAETFADGHGFPFAPPNLATQPA